MKNFLTLLIIIAGGSLFSQVELDPYYHTYDEILAELDSLQTLYPEWIMVQQIGMSSGAPYQEQLPIYAAKLSDNVTEDEDEPAVLFIGQVHAEEVLGIEITLYMINDLLEHRFQTPWRIWLENMEIWFVPTYNPEGLQVVMDAWDVSFRKNKRDNNNNNVFDFEVVPGGDIDGVDINRNYSFNWIHGDTLYTPQGEELYDYYRGAAPFSESETRVIRDLAEEHHFILSVCWHSSRTGNLSEKVFYSLEWDGVKRCPDFDMNRSIGENVASRIPLEPPQSGFYEPSPSRGRKGNTHDWFYQVYGTVQLLIECGTQNLQPPEPIIIDTCERNSQGAYWMLSRILGYQTTDKALLTGHITDAVTGEPLVAELFIPEKYASYFKPRLSEALYGRFWRLISPGTYTLHFRKHGYEELVLNNVVVNNSGWTDLDNAPFNGIQLNPLASVEITGNLSGYSAPLCGEIIVFNEFTSDDTIQVIDGSFSLSTFAGNLALLVNAEGFVPRLLEFQYEGGNYDLDIEMEPAVEIFSEQWQDGFSAWNVYGDWAILIDDLTGELYADDSPDVFYTDGDTYTLSLAAPINLHGVSNDVVMVLKHKFYVEHDRDFCKIDISTDGINWHDLSRFTGIGEGWQKEYLPLSEYIGNYIYLRFALAADATVNDPGWKIAGMDILASTGAAAEDGSIILPPTRLHNNVPNPFNPETRITFQLQEAAEASLLIYNLKGQLVRTLLSRELPAGVHQCCWDGRDDQGKSSSSGIYFYQLESRDFRQFRKMILMK